MLLSDHYVIDNILGSIMIADNSVLHTTYDDYNQVLYFATTYIDLSAC